MDIESRSGERTGEARPRWKRVLLSGSLAATLLASSFLGMIPQAADGAIAGVQKVLDEQGQTLDEFDEAGDDCRVGSMKYCASFDVNLADGVVFQAQLNKPTSSADLVLVNSFGTKVASEDVSAQESGWLEVAVSSSGESTWGLSVQQPGQFRLMVGSNSRLHYNVYGFTIPDAWKKVNPTSTTQGVFDSKSSKRSSGKNSVYQDGVLFDGKKGMEISIAFTSSSVSGRRVVLRDQYGNNLADESSEITKYKLEYDGLYQVYISGDTQGKFTLKLTETIRVKSLELDKAAVMLRTAPASKKTITLKAIVSPSNATNKKVTWKSSNTGVVKVGANGKLTAVKPGTATVTAKTRDGGKTAKVQVTVKKGIAVTSVKVTPKKVTLKLSKVKTATLTAVVSPSNAANKKVTWKSPNSKVVKVDKNGKITAVKKGKATVTATTKSGGKTAKVQVTVKKK